MQNAGRQTPTLSDARREQIQALIETPEMRRIFGDGPEARTGTPPGRKDGSRDRESRQPAPRRRGVGKRIAVGLVPVYLAIPIILYEAGPDATALLDLSRPSAEQVPEGTAEATAFLTGPVVERTAAAGANRAAPNAGNSERGALARGGTSPGMAKGVSAAGRSSGDVEKKSAIDVGKQWSQDAAAFPQATHSPGGETDAASPPLSPPARQAEAQPESGSYPDPREGMASGFADLDLEQAAATEEALRLSRSDRREIQRRLRLAEFDPQLIDGMFGPATRAAIEGWQASAGIPATGYVDEASMALLVEQTAEEYQAWRAAERARQRREAEQSAVVATSGPPTRMATGAQHCRRSGAGGIAFGQGMRCDVRGLRENFSTDFDGLKRELRQLFR